MQRLDATLALDPSVQDYGRLQRVVILGTQGSNSRGEPGKEIRLQSDAYEQRISDYIQSHIIKTAVTELPLVTSLAKRIRRHDFKLFLGKSADMNILFGFDDGQVKELKASEQLTTVYIPRAMRLMTLLGHDVSSMMADFVKRVDYLYENMRVKDLDTILQKYVKPVLAHAFALFSDVGGWLDSDSYKWGKPDVCSLVKHVDPTLAASYADPRLSLRVEKP
eukprot:SAG11_NODE_4066_length_2081_cov_4.470737_1_plen_221_part_00